VWTDAVNPVNPVKKRSETEMPQILSNLGVVGYRALGHCAWKLSRSDR